MKPKRIEHQITHACFDIDGTIWTEADTGLFSDYWNSLTEGRKPRLIYNTGRAIADTLPLLESGTIPRAEILIGGLGTELLYDGDAELSGLFRDYVSWNWRRDEIRRWAETNWDIRLRAPRWTTDLRLSWMFAGKSAVDSETVALELARCGMCGRVIPGSELSFDIVPERASKGAALKWLCGRLSVRLENVVVAGNEANDATMYELKGVSRIILRHSHSSLHRRWRSGRNFRATLAGPAGVSEGLSFLRRRNGKNRLEP